MTLREWVEKMQTDTLNGLPHYASLELLSAAKTLIDAVEARQADYHHRHSCPVCRDGTDMCYEGSILFRADIDAQMAAVRCLRGEDKPNG